MPVVFVRCPSKGTKVSTRRYVSPTDFQRENFAGASFRCEICGAVHHWKKADAWLEQLNCRNANAEAALAFLSGTN